jgi:hypothetical protein
MSDTQTVRSDLAFMRAVAEDRGPLPRTIGEHMLAPGLIFTANFLLIWAIYRGWVDWPARWAAFLWAPGAVVYLAIYPILMRRARGAAMGPAARAFAAAWCGVALMTAGAVATTVAASLALDRSFYEIWPSLAFVLYGGAWAAVAIVRKQLGWGLVALGCFATAVIAAATLTAPLTWLVLAAGLFLFVAGPGWAIVRRAEC